MTAIIIIAAVILFILILLYIPVTVEFSFLNKIFNLRVKYLIFTFFSIPMTKKPKKIKLRRLKREDTKKTEEEEKVLGKNAAGKKAETTAEADGEDDDIDLEGSAPMGKKTPLFENLSERKRQISLIWQLCQKHLVKIIGNVAADRVCIDITAAGEDAYSAAMLYGKINAAVWNAVAVTLGCMKIKYDRVNIKADFNSEEPVYDISARVKITPAVVAGNLIVSAVKLLLNLKKIRGKL